MGINQTKKHRPQKRPRSIPLAINRGLIEVPTMMVAQYEKLMEVPEATKTTITDYPATARARSNRARENHTKSQI